MGVLHDRQTDEKFDDKRVEEIDEEGPNKGNHEEGFEGGTILRGDRIHVGNRHGSCSEA